MATMTDLLKEIRSNGISDAKNRWWVAEILATDCEKAWTHAGWEDTMLKWYEWLAYTKKKGEEKDGRVASAKGGANDQACRRLCWTSAQNHKANDVEARSTDLGERGRRCEVVRSL